MSDEDVVEATYLEEGATEPTVLEVHVDTVDQPEKYEQVAREVLAGQWGRGRRRAQRLQDAGYDVKRVYEQIDSILHQ